MDMFLAAYINSILLPLKPIGTFKKELNKGTLNPKRL
jgi:hypothetical protein